MSFLTDDAEGGYVEALAEVQEEAERLRAAGDKLLEGLRPFVVVWLAYVEWHQRMAAEDGRDWDPDAHFPDDESVEDLANTVELLARGPRLTFGQMKRAAAVMAEVEGEADG